MRWLLPLLPCLVAACGDDTDDSSVETDSDTDSDTDTDTDTDTDADTDTDTDADTDTDTDTDPYQPTDPLFEAIFGGGHWETGDGHWLAGNTSYLVAIKGDEQVSVEVDANVGEPGVSNVRAFTYYESIHNGYVFNYKLTSGTATFEVHGLDTEGDALWGELNGQLTLTDSEAGGTLTVDGLTLESWRRYGTK